MSKIEERLAALKLVLPQPIKAPVGVALPFQFVRVLGIRALIFRATARRIRMAPSRPRSASSERTHSPSSKATAQLG